MSSLIGKTIGNYELVRSLGKGGMGEVYLGEHPEIGQRVAVKVLSTDALAHSGAERFLVEARLLVQLDHPNIVRIHDYGKTDDGRLYYIMEYLDGVSLGELIEDRGVISPQDACRLLEQICDALDAAHNHGVVHRDLKPDNVFVTRAGGKERIRVLDFGIAKILEGDGGLGSTQTGQVLGSPLFISPEQALGVPGKIGTCTDIYALGVMMFYMVSGEPPFFDEAPGRLLALHMDAPPPPLKEFAPHLPAPACAVVDQCLCKEPEDRPESASEVYRRFKAGLYESTTQDGPAEEPYFELDIASDSVSRSRSISRGDNASVEDSSGMREISLEVDSADAPLQLQSPGEDHAYATTVSASVGELHSSEDAAAAPAGQSNTRWKVGVVLSAALGLALVAALVIGSADKQRPAASPAAAPASRPAAQERRSFTVQVAGAPDGAQCRFSIEGARKLIVVPPCEINVKVGEELDLEVLAGGAVLLHEVWQVTGDRVLKVPALPAPVVPDAGVTKPSAKRRSVKPARRKPRRKPRTAPAKKGQEILGEGVLDDF